MGLKIAIAEVTANNSEMDSTLNVLVESCNILKTTIDQFIADEQLTGAAYSSAKNYYESVYKPLIDGILLLCELLQKDNDDYVRQFNSQVDGSSSAQLDEDVLENARNELSEQITRQASLIANTQLPENGNSSFGVDQTALMKLDEQLVKLRSFDAFTARQYENLTSVIRQINAGIKITQSKHFDSKTGKFIFNNSSKNMNWVSQLDDLALKADGWDEDSISAYHDFLKKELKGIDQKKNPQEYAKKLAELKASRFLIGSALYEKMFDSSKMASEDKLKMVVSQMNAKIDENGFLQVSGKYHLNPNMPPHDSFLKKFRICVQEAFPKNKSLADYAKENGEKAVLANEVHCFRSYIDKNNIEYIRSHFDGKNDYEKLLAYREKYGLTFDYKTGANYHNRYDRDKGFSYPKNMKVQVPDDSKMSEFIVNMDSGEFVSEWSSIKYNPDGTVNSNPSDYSKSELEAIADTESFNYGKPNSSDGNHGPLDISHPKDPDLRSTATSQWKYEHGVVKDDIKGNYADIVQVKADKNGENKDLEAWQKIPVEDREEVYQEFVKHIKDTGENKGFAEFSK